jgi:hypothetical protein
METTKPCSACNGTGRIPRGRVLTSAEILAGLEGHWHGTSYLADGSTRRNCTCSGWLGHPSFERLTADPEQRWEEITTSTSPFWTELS